MDNPIPSLDLQRYIDLCYEYGRRSTCSKARYGSVIVTTAGNYTSRITASPYTEYIVGHGWNHSPNPACEDCATLCAGKLRLGVKSGTRKVVDFTAAQFKQTPRYSEGIGCGLQTKTPSKRARIVIRRIRQRGLYA